MEIFFGSAKRVGDALLERKWLLATAESCTGGWVATSITSVPGSSDWFERGFVTYSNAAKQEMLEVPAALLLKHGAVSEECVRAMAQGALQHSRADVSVAITGIAGPDGGTVEKPVGGVWIGWAHRAGTIKSESFQFSGDREEVRKASVDAALAGILALVESLV